MVHRYPSETGSKDLLHLVHGVAGEAAKIRKPVTVLGRDNEAELMAVLPPALHKLTSVRRAGFWPMLPSPFSFPARSIALQLTEMCAGALAHPFQPLNPRLYYHPEQPLNGAALLRGTLQCQ